MTVQALADHVVVFEAADTDFGVPEEAPCAECGGMVKLTSEITVTRAAADGSETTERMTEANARQLLAEVGIPPPPVLCDRHGEVEIETWA